MTDTTTHETVNRCKGCRASVRVKEDVITHALEELTAQGAILVTDAVYEQRLAQCRVCAEFVYGTTCRICGCLLPVRARLAGKSCPLPGAAKW